MCGIVGLVLKERQKELSAAELFTMCKMQSHRGPDDIGGVSFDLDDCVVREISQGDLCKCKGLFGFSRLSIQDLSANGHQPMRSDDSSVAVVFNGEIYNFVEMRAELQCRGHKFRGLSDTEVILHMYLEYGIEQTLDKLNGMFALAVVDMRIKKVFISRDRLGIKPLYIASVGDAILFASEIKALIPYHDFSVQLNKEALEEYLLFKSLMTDTLFQGVEQVKPGSLTIIDLQTNESHSKQFFDIEDYSRSENMKSYADIKEEFIEVFRDVVRRQRISDVRVGCQLSGGIDSSILSKVLSDEHNVYDTVSCKVECDQQSDIPYIDFVNRELKATSHIGYMNAGYFVNNLIDVVWNFESILSHTPAVGMYQISECSQKSGIKVLLSGEGADELFGGYKCFSKLSFSDKSFSHDEVVNEIIFRDGRETQSFLNCIIPGIEPEKYYQDRIDYFNHFSGSNFDVQVKYELGTQLRELLDRQDKMAMAHSVENRVPFLDNSLMSFAWNIPENFLMNSKLKEGKFILKDIAASCFGRDFAFRKKVGFFIPGNLFLGSNMEFVHYVLQDCRKRGLVNCAPLEKWADEDIHIIGKLGYFQSAVFFKMFTFEIWCQLFLDGLSVEQCKARYGLL